VEDAVSTRVDDVDPSLVDATMGVSTGSEGVAEDKAALLRSDAMPSVDVDLPSVPDTDADGEYTNDVGTDGECTTLDVDVAAPEPTILGTLSSIHRRRDFHVIVNTDE
jgi:hypothetical protein